MDVFDQLYESILLRESDPNNLLWTGDWEDYFITRQVGMDIDPSDFLSYYREIDTKIPERILDLFDKHRLRLFDRFKIKFLVIFYLNNIVLMESEDFLAIKKQLDETIGPNIIDSSKAIPLLLRIGKIIWQSSN